MDRWNIPASRKPGKAALHAVEDALRRTFGRGYDHRVADHCITYDALAAEIASQIDVKPEAAGACVAMTLHGLQRLIQRSGDRGKPGSLPKLAAALVYEAIDVLMEGLPNDRTMIAYRNRHKDFVHALASYADSVSGDRIDHGDFYSELGRKVALSVLEHNLVDHDQVAALPHHGTYEAISASALEQMVYFIGAGARGPIKIGIAANPQSRLSSLQTAHHEELSILALTSGGRAQELSYHAMFAGRRLKGEWFNRCPEIEAEIARLNPAAMIGQ